MKSAKTAIERLFSLVTTVMELVRDGKRDPKVVADILQIIKDRKDFANIFVKASLGVADVFRIQVNYDLSIKKAIKGGKYGQKDYDINDEHFPSKRSGSAKVDIYLVHFNKDMSSVDVLEELDKMGLRSAELPELLALGAQYPDEQKKNPIVALDFVARGWLNRHVPYLWFGFDDDERNVSLDDSGRGWLMDYRFAAVSK